MVFKGRPTPTSPFLLSKTETPPQTGAAQNVGLLPLNSWSGGYFL